MQRNSSARSPGKAQPAQRFSPLEVSTLDGQSDAEPTTGVDEAGCVASFIPFSFWRHDDLNSAAAGHLSAPTLKPTSIILEEDELTAVLLRQAELLLFDPSSDELPAITARVRELMIDEIRRQCRIS
jgi:hypothetical protein